MELEKLYIILLCTLLVAFGFALNSLMRGFIEYNELKQTSMKIESNCSGMDLMFTANCLNNQLNKFFKYNVSNTGKNLTLKELKEQGGVCKHYSQFYTDNLISLGGKLVEDSDFYKSNNSYPFYVEQVKIPTDNESSHIFTIVANKQYICILDQQHVTCTEFVEVENES